MRTLDAHYQSSSASLREKFIKLAAAGINPTIAKEQRNREYRYRMSIIHMLFVISMAILSSVSSMETETLEKSLKNCQPSTLPYLPLK